MQQVSHLACKINQSNQITTHAYRNIPASESNQIEIALKNTFLRKPLVPGFWPSYGFVSTVLIDKLILSNLIRTIEFITKN